MGQTTDLRKIVDDWFNVYKTRVPNLSPLWATIDPNDKRLKDFFKQYPDYELEDYIYTSFPTYELKNKRFDWTDISVETDLMFEERHINDSSSDDSTTIQKTERISDTFEYSFTEGFTAGVSTTSKIGDGIAGWEWGLSFELDFSATQTTAQTKEREWIISKNIVLPAKSCTKCKWIVDQNKMHGIFSADMVVKGCAIVFIKREHDFYCPMPVQIYSIVQDIKTPGIVIGDAVAFKVRCIVSANIHSEDSDFQKKSEPLSGNPHLNTYISTATYIANKYKRSQDEKIQIVV